MIALIQIIGTILSILCIGILVFLWMMNSYFKNNPEETWFEHKTKETAPREQSTNILPKEVEKSKSNHLTESLPIPDFKPSLIPTTNINPHIKLNELYK